MVTQYKYIQINDLFEYIEHIYIYIYILYCLVLQLSEDSLILRLAMVLPFKTM